MPLEPNLQKSIQERLAALPEELQQLIRSDYLDQTVATLQGSFSLTETQARRLSTEVILTIFLFEPLSTLTERLGKALEINEETAKQLYQALYQAIFAAYIDVYELPELLDETIADNGGPRAEAVLNATETPPDTTTPMTPVESPAGPVPVVRTMAGDAAKAQAGGNTEPTYTSSQETLLGESPAKSDTPAQQ